MKNLFYILISFLPFSCTNTKKDGNEKLTGIIGEYYENDLPVIVKFDSVMPDTTITSKLPWFTVISWKYDGSERNGMPPEPINAKMIEFEGELDSIYNSNLICKHAYNRTGNHLKEFNYYIADRDEFMKQFNNVLQHKTHYPIEISFYEDSAWVEQQTIFNDFLK